MRRKRGLSKTALLEQVAEKCAFDPRDVAVMFNALTDVVKGELRAGRKVVVPGLVQLRPVIKAATVERRAYNAMLRREVVRPARPERRSVRVRLMPALKDAV